MKKLLKSKELQQLEIPQATLEKLERREAFNTKNRKMDRGGKTKRDILKKKYPGSFNILLLIFSLSFLLTGCTPTGVNKSLLVKISVTAGITAMVLFSLWVILKLLNQDMKKISRINSLFILSLICAFVAFITAIATIIPS